MQAEFVFELPAAKSVRSWARYEPCRNAYRTSKDYARESMLQSETVMARANFLTRNFAEIYSYSYRLYVFQFISKLNANVIRKRINSNMGLHYDYIEGLLKETADIFFLFIFLLCNIDERLMMDRIVGQARGGSSRPACLIASYQCLRSTWNPW